jgi:hypothetical protein
MTQDNKIKIRRGVVASLPSGGTEAGELRYATDSKELYIDDGTFNIKIGSDTSTGGINSVIQTALDGKQSLDTDLTAIAGLDSSLSGAIASDGAGWVKKTYAQFKTALILVKADVGLGSVDNTADTAKPVSSAQQTALDGKQALDGDLTDVAALTPTDNDILQRKSGHWTNRTLAQLLSDLSLGSVYQPLDSDLTDIAALTPADDDIIQRKAGIWAKRTIAQLKTDLNYQAADFGAQPLDSDLTAIAALIPSDGDVIRRVSGAWAAQSLATLKTALALAASDIASGTFDIARIPTGTSGTTVPFGNDSRFTDSRAPSGTAGGCLNGTYPNPSLDLVTSAPYTHGTTSGTVTIDPTLGNNVMVTASANITALTPSTTGAVDGQMLMVSVAPGGTGRTVTVSGPILTTGLSAANAIAASKVGFFGFRYSSQLSAWVLLAYTASV